MHSTISINTCMKIHEVTTKPQAPLSPDQARLAALKNQVKRSQEAVKAERARQKMRSAQQALSKSSALTA